MWLLHTDPEEEQQSRRDVICVRLETTLADRHTDEVCCQFHVLFAITVPLDNGRYLKLTTHIHLAVRLRMVKLNIHIPMRV